MPPNQDSQTTFKPNLTCIFLSARARYFVSNPDGGPCRPFWLPFRKSWNFFQILQNPVIFVSFFLKISPFLHVYCTKFIKKNLPVYKFLVFSKIPHEISKFLIYWDCPHYVWMRKEIKFYIDLIYFHSDFAIQFMNKSVFAENIFRGNIVFRVFKIRRCRCSKSR